jgi:hypothetical protein
LFIGEARGLAQGDVVDEEALSQHLTAERRLETGAFFTPRPLVDQVLDLVSPYLPAGGPARVVDPACGAGAFLVAAHERFPAAQLVGAELDGQSAMQARSRVRAAHVLDGDVLTTDVLSPALGSGFELWVGNPPYNGTSPLLRDKAAWARACAWLPGDFTLPKHTSLREDYVFFLLRASMRLGGHEGALAFITSATLLDAYNYAPVRQALLGRLQLREVVDLGAGAFEGTMVRTCITVWTTARDERAARFAGVDFAPRSPSFALRPSSDEAEALDAQWRAGGATIGELVPVSFPGLKTRFDELLVDDDAARLLERVSAFLSTTDLRAFAARFELADELVPKLAELKASCGPLTVREDAVRPFIRYRGPRPVGPRAFCYLERALIPRGDHRLRGDYDPHRHAVKLVFNQHEVPLAAHVFEAGGCVTAYRHSRFAPLEVPRALLAEPNRPKLRADEPLAVNLSAKGLEWAAQLGSPRAVFAHIARHVMSDDFQRVWAPARGTAAAPLIAPPQPFTRPVQEPLGL